MKPSNDRPRARTLESREWILVRCRECNALLHKMERDALRPGKCVESKCSKCNAMNYSLGDDIAA